MKKRIMFVDDDVSLLAGLRNVLYRERERWEMVFVASGEDALAELDRGSFDVVISDMRMAGMDGLTLLEHVRERSPDTARVILSGSADKDEVERVSKSVDELLGKPCDARTLRATLERMLQRRVV